MIIVGRKKWDLLNARLDLLEKVLAKVELDSNEYLPFEGECESWSTRGMEPRSTLGITRHDSHYQSMRTILLTLLDYMHLRLSSPKAGALRLVDKEYTP
jgi:hypothetical protein